MPYFGDLPVRKAPVIPAGGYQNVYHNPLRPLGGNGDYGQTVFNSQRGNNVPWMSTVLPAGMPTMKLSEHSQGVRQVREDLSSRGGAQGLPMPPQVPAPWFPVNFVGDRGVPGMSEKPCGWGNQVDAQTSAIDDVYVQPLWVDPVTVRPRTVLFGPQGRREGLVGAGQCVSMFPFSTGERLSTVFPLPRQDVHVRTKRAGVGNAQPIGVDVIMQIGQCGDTHIPRHMQQNMLDDGQRRTQWYQTGYVLPSMGPPSPVYVTEQPRWLG
jgi:hypothetical protein